MPGIYGNIPAPVALPDPFGNLKKRLPGIENLNQTASGVLQDRFAGRIPIADQNFLQDRNAEWAGASGMGFQPGAGSLSANRGARDLGLTQMALQDKAFQQLNPFVSTVSGTQTVAPELEANIQRENFDRAAAPDPTAAGTHAENLFMKYQKMLKSPTGDDWTGAAKPLTTVKWGNPYS